MGALVQGFEYDIFISYRQKDNKGEKWVTRFVEALKTELDATLKDDLSIYFDENPHDGLLETHDVDESLREKLKCLVFIPIVSQTYCDPKSFAWRSEFLAFKGYATESDYGLKVRLANGNFTNRILPIRIHDLDAADRQLIENEIGPLRAIDFIFKSAGVNRPLALVDDQVRVSGQLLYRDQVNKTANAIKEILFGLKNIQPSTPVSKPAHALSPEFFNVKPKAASTAKSIALFGHPRTSKKDMPLALGIGNEIITHLSQTKELRIFDRHPEILEENIQSFSKRIERGIEYGIIVMVAEANQKMEFSIFLKNLRNGETVWEKNYAYPGDDLFRIIGQAIEGITKSLAFTPIGQYQPSSNNQLAYDNFIQGLYLSRQESKEALQQSIVFFEKAIEQDQGFSRAHSCLALVHCQQILNLEIPVEAGITLAKAEAYRALELDVTQLESFAALSFISMCYEWNWPEAETYFTKVFSLNPKRKNARRKYELILAQIKLNFEEAEEEPIQSIPYFIKSYSLLHKGEFDKALLAAKEAIAKDPNSFMTHRALGLSYLGLEDFPKAIEYLEQAASLSNRHRWLLFELMGANTLHNKTHEAQLILDEVMAQANVLPARIFGYFNSID